MLKSTQSPICISSARQKIWILFAQVVRDRYLPLGFLPFPKYSGSRWKFVCGACKKTKKQQQQKYCLKNFNEISLSRNCASARLDEPQNRLPTIFRETVSSVESSSDGKGWQGSLWIIQGNWDTVFGKRWRFFLSFKHLKRDGLVQLPFLVGWQKYSRPNSSWHTLHGFISISYLLVTIPQTTKGKWEEMAYLDAFQACFTISEQAIIIKIIPWVSFKYFFSYSFTHITRMCHVVWMWMKSFKSADVCSLLAFRPRDKVFFVGSVDFIESLRI